MAHWQGYITAVHGRTFTAWLRDMQSIEAEKAVLFAREDIAEAERIRIREHACIEWIIGAGHWQQEGLRILPYPTWQVGVEPLPPAHAKIWEVWRGKQGEE